jgi:hypothetical protein
MILASGMETARLNVDRNTWLFCGNNNNGCPVSFDFLQGRVAGDIVGGTRVLEGVVMDKLEFHTQEMPEMSPAGARFVVVAYCGTWRDGLTTNFKTEIPQLQRELRKRFMNRLETPEPIRKDSISTASFRINSKGELRRI